MEIGQTTESHTYSYAVYRYPNRQELTVGNEWERKWLEMLTDFNPTFRNQAGI